MGRTKRPGDYKHAEHILQNYRGYQRELREAEEAVALPAHPDMGTPVRGGLPSDATGKAGIRLATDKRIAYLRMATRAVEQALFSWADRAGGAAVVEMIRLVYWARTHTLEGAALKVGYCYRHALRLRAAFVMEVMDGMGWDADQCQLRH